MLVPLKQPLTLVLPQLKTLAKLFLAMLSLAHTLMLKKSCLTTNKQQNLSMIN
ncbi:hypothetical protein LFUMFP_500018 [Latilactobacillus fuchuensis]|uniref:Uncharacterized protein n=1 Tax=Latilactobacillus fuchuensis TaxID=164393 RepID=A0A2N9DY26_9LACO|nr:hypothetical protein LFUMFP_500018 [Latilactobacillus fuchuensis]